MMSYKGRYGLFQRRPRYRAFHGPSAGCGVTNAIILPTVMAYNAEATGEKYREIARTMGVAGVAAMSQEEYRRVAIDVARKISEDVGIPADLKDIVKREDIPFLAQSAYDDVCRPGNPKETSVADITKLYEALI